MKKILSYSLLLAIISACTERIDITTDNATPRLAITGYITTENGPHKVQVSRTVGYFGSEKPMVYANATVKINNVDLEYDQTDGYYKTDKDFVGIPGETYKLEVWVDFNGDGTDEYYTASTTMPALVQLDSMSLRPMRANRPEGPPWVPFVHFMDVPGPNFYGAHLYINKFQYSSDLTRYFLNFFDDKAAEGQYINFPILEYWIREEIHWINDEIIILRPGDTITIELNLLSPEYFEFLRTAKEELNGGNPLFAGPPANIPGNISGNILGVFGSYTVSRAHTILKSTPDFPSR